MKILVIPDVHLKTWLFDRAEGIMISGKADMAVCLMDLPDDWGMEFQIDKYRDIYDRAIAFANTFPDTIWCYGNHDLSYPWGYLETGYSPYAENTVISKLEELKNTVTNSSQINIIQRVDNVIFSHGGLSEDYVSWLDEGLLDADIDDVLDAINTAPEDYLWNDESPLWLRPQYNDRKAFRSGEFIQVVGHTPVDMIEEKNEYISTDVFSTYRDGTQIGESAMIIIDSETKEYEKYW